METAEIICSKLSTMPKHLIKEVNDFIDFKLSKEGKEKNITRKPVLGSGKGTFVMMPGFDEPLEDFKDYI